MKRRDALKLAGATSLAAMITPAFAKAKPRKVLILGGTGFIGPHFVDALSANKHKITLFNRGKRDPEARPGIEQLIADLHKALDDRPAPGARAARVAVRHHARGRADVAPRGHRGDGRGDRGRP